MALLCVLVVASLLAPASAGAGDRTPLVAQGAVEVDPRLESAFSTLPSLTPYGAFVHFQDGSSAEQKDLLIDRGLRIGATFEAIDVMYAIGTLGDIRGLTHEPSIGYLEADRKLRYSGDTAVWATRVRAAQKKVIGGPYRDPAGNVLDGRGVGVAIVDSGIDATHPDLAERVQANFKIVCTTPGLINVNTGQCFGPLAFVNAADASTDTSSGHGTHVAGIVAGDGTASGGTGQGTYMGVAPRATLYGY
ncbi:MAG: S8 family serine peptidase, partial [Actinomycetota bacterium]|nr:S8 family serine peptidase [Actinomycetota bacterium]